MRLSQLLEEIRRIMYVRNIDPEIREPLIQVVQNAWTNIEEAGG